MSRLITSQRAWLTPNWVREDLSRKAQALPSLDLRFADNKSLADATTGANLVTFTRASSGTYVGSDGVLQTATTNLLLRSEEFNDASWTKQQSSISSNVTTAPNGTLTADKLIEDSSNNIHTAYVFPTGLRAASALTFSVYAKSSERTSFALDVRAVGNGFRAVFDLSAQTAIGAAIGSGTLIGAGIQSIGNGWFRCFVTGSHPTDTSLNTTIRLNNPAGTDTYTGDGTSGLFLWGAQLEQSSTVGEYIPTTSTINSAPRFDHAITSSVTNLLLRSEELNSLPWGNQGTAPTITANATTAPNGTLTADRITFAAADSRLTQASLPIVSGATYTISVYALAVGATNNKFRLAFFDQSAQSNSSDFTASSNQWQRFSFTLTSTQTNNLGLLQIRNATDNAANDIYFWGAQLEQSSTVGTYVPTTTAAATSNTTESLGLLVEEQRTNLVTSSATFQPSSVGNPASYTVDQVAPDGTTTASRQTAANPRTFVDYQGIANAQYTFSVYAKAASGTVTIALQLKNAATDTVIATGSNVTLTTAWQRLTVTGTTNGATTGARIEVIGPVVGAPAGTVFWGAQLEAGAFPTSYIPTTTATATRNADVASITGSNFSSWYRQDEGTVFAEMDRNTAITSSSTAVSFNDNTLNNRLLNFRHDNSTSFTVLSTTGGTLDGTVNVSLIGTSSRNKVAAAQALNNLAASSNGSAIVADTSVAIPTVNQMQIGNVTNVSVYNGTIRRLTFWPARLPNSTLQTLTQ